MDLRSLSDVDLDASAIVAARNERAALVEVLRHLAEVDLRKSFSPRYETIHAYAVSHLGYDSKSAWRRVNAMKLMTELPEITPAIESGKLDLTKLIIAQNYFRIEEKASVTPSKSEKIEVLESVMCRTSREAVRELISKSSAPEKLSRPDLVKPLAGDSNEVRLVMSDEDLATIRELKGLLAHKHPNASLGEVISAALKEALTGLRKAKSGENLKRRAAREYTRSDAEVAKSEKPTCEVQVAKAENTRRPGRELRRQVWNRAGGKCEICESTISLEFDHRVPFARGGKTNTENLRLLCRNCNQRESNKIFGPRRSI